MYYKYRLIWLLAICLFSISPAMANTFTIYVAELNTPAYSAAQKKADGKAVLVERSLQKALSHVPLLLIGDNTLVINVASGELKGSLGSSSWVIPTVQAPLARLHILGGWNEDFSQRNPFLYLSRLLTQPGRTDANLVVEKNSQIGNLVISGFTFNTKPSNQYGAGNNLHKSGTANHRMISFNQLKTNELVVSDNIFFNAPLVVFEPYVSPLSDNTEVDIRNNFFINNVIPIQELTGNPMGKTLNTIRLRQNSFILNWPYNPDPTSSNVGAIGLYHKGGIYNVEIENNLFAYNVGGVFQHDWPVNRMPQIEIRDNLFFQNGALFGKTAPGDGAIVGKFGANPRYLVLNINELEDNFDYVIANNVSKNPKIHLLQSLHVEVDGENSEADLLVSGHAPPVDIEADKLPFADAEIGRYGVIANESWPYIQ